MVGKLRFMTFEKKILTFFLLDLVTLKLLKATLSNDQDEEDLCEHCSRKRKERRTKLKRIKSRTNFETASTTFTDPNTSASNTVGLKSESSYRRPFSESDTTEDRLTAEDLLRYNTLSPIEK